MATEQNIPIRVRGQLAVPVTCVVCGTSFLAPAGEVRKRGRKYCGFGCRSKGRAKVPLADRLRAKTVKTEGGCWVWTGSTNEKGYGLIGGGDGKNISTHRAAWLVTRGAIPRGAHILHRCDNPPCVNPDHLFLGDNFVNQQDCTAKGRKNFARGEKHWKAKLTDVAVIAIRERHAAGETRRHLATEFGVNKTTIDRVIRRRFWRHLA